MVDISGFHVGIYRPSHGWVMGYVSCIPTVILGFGTHNFPSVLKEWKLGSWPACRLGWQAISLIGNVFFPTLCCGVFVFSAPHPGPPPPHSSFLLLSLTPSTTTQQQHNNTTTRQQQQTQQHDNNNRQNKEHNNLTRTCMREQQALRDRCGTL